MVEFASFQAYNSRGRICVMVETQYVRLDENVKLISHENN